MSECKEEAEGMICDLGETFGVIRIIGEDKCAAESSAGRRSAVFPMAMRQNDLLINVNGHTYLPVPQWLYPFSALG